MQMLNAPIPLAVLLVLARMDTYYFICLQITIQIGDGKKCFAYTCANNNGGCDANAVCADSLNPLTASTCTCRTGFVWVHLIRILIIQSGNGYTCSDINECLVKNGGCDANATCTNLHGFRKCECKAGFVCIYF